MDGDCFLSLFDIRLEVLVEELLRHAVLEADDCNLERAICPKASRLYV